MNNVSDAAAAAAGTARESAFVGGADVLRVNKNNIVYHNNTIHV